MGFSFTTFLQGAEKAVVQLAPSLAGAISPALGAVVTVTANAINAAQATGAAPADKKTQVLNTLEASAPAISTLLGQAGINVSDPTKFANGASALVEAVLDMMKGTGTLAPAATPLTPAPNVPATSLSVPNSAPVTCTLVSFARTADGISLLLNLGGTK